MNVLKPAKVRELCRLFAYGHGIRESGKLAKINRGTVAKYHREWLKHKPELQRAYDLLWEGDGEGWDKIMETIPDPYALACGDAWLDDQFDEAPKSNFLANG